MGNIKKEMLCFKALSDPLRVQLLRVIHEKERVCVCVLTERFCTSQSKLSYHLKMLLDANFIAIHPTGKWNFYSIRMDTFQKLLSQETIEKILKP